MLLICPKPLVQLQLGIRHSSIAEPAFRLATHPALSPASSTDTAKQGIARSDQDNFRNLAYKQQKRTPFKRLEGQFSADKCASKEIDADSQPLDGAAATG